MLIEHMLELVNAVHQITTLPKTIIRLLLDYFKWDKDALIEQYFEHSNPRHFVKSTILPSLADNSDDIPSLLLRPYTDVRGGESQFVRSKSLALIASDGPCYRIGTLNFQLKSEAAIDKALI